MFISTRNSSLRISASEAILKGMSAEGGLFLSEKIPNLPIQELVGKSYADVAIRVLEEYLNDFTPDEIAWAVHQAYSSENFPEKVMDVASFGSYSFLELFHGQTLTFKDMALSLLPYLMELALKKHPEEKGLRILTATSGDTGSAVLASFTHSSSIPVSVLYPEGGISYLQEKQMLSFTSPMSRAYALKKANFDDCQRLVKTLLVQKGNRFTSANSINIGRLLPQIVYYYDAYLSLVQNQVIRMGEVIDVVVPTGNFGDIFAAYLSKKMSLPLGKLVVASNENRVLDDFFTSGVYQAKRPFLKTNSPSMDILVSSNLERLLYLTCLDDRLVKKMMADLSEKGSFSVDPLFLKKLQADFASASSDEKETENAIARCFKEKQYLLDPHTAVAYSAYLKKGSSLPNQHALIVATASPLKFPRTILESLGLSEKDEKKALEKCLTVAGMTLPVQLKKALLSPSPRYEVSPAEFKSLVKPHHSYEVEVPATSANLGPGFDVCGIALSLRNRFLFEKSDHDELSGFIGEEETKDNLVLKSYHRFFEVYSFQEMPVRISLKEQEIPLSRGLGSSASCIVAGLLAANAFAGRYLPKEKLLDLASEIEGHPDNVAPCLFGGFVTSFKEENGSLHPLTYPVAPSLGFLVVIPAEELSTEQARKILPSSYPLKDIVFDSSRLINLPQALKEGELPLLQELLQDKLHVPYRSPLIKEAAFVGDIASKYGLPFTISGAGSSLLLLFKKGVTPVDEVVNELKKSLPASCQIQSLSIANNGASLREVKA